MSSPVSVSAGDNSAWKARSSVPKVGGAEAGGGVDVAAISKWFSSRAAAADVAEGGTIGDALQMIYVIDEDEGRDDSDGAPQTIVKIHGQAPKEMQQKVEYKDEIVEHSARNKEKDNEKYGDRRMQTEKNEELVVFFEAVQKRAVAGDIMESALNLPDDVVGIYFVVGNFLNASALSPQQLTVHAATADAMRDDLMSNLLHRI